jgi:hypothetical protein
MTMSTLSRVLHRLGTPRKYRTGRGAADVEVEQLAERHVQARMPPPTGVVSGPLDAHQVGPKASMVVGSQFWSA